LVWVISPRPLRSASRNTEEAGFAVKSDRSTAAWLGDAAVSLVECMDVTAA